MAPLDRLTRRVIASHAIAALAVALPWPLLLVLVDEQSGDPLLLGVVGAARMLPYVAFSWATARLADRLRRDLIVRVTLVLRAALLLAGALAVVTDHVWMAVAACTLTVAVGTPAYPAQVAAMPGIAGPERRKATDLLVTIEVAAFVVGAALGGLLLHPATRGLLPWLPVAMTVVALAMIFPVSMPAPVRAAGAEQRISPSAALRRAPAALRAIAVMAAVNFVIALVAVALLPLALEGWSSDAAGYGLATGVLGFAAFGAPVLRRLGRTTEHSIGWGLVLLALGLVLVIPVPTVGWALAPLALAGAAAVSVEAGATAVLQENVSDEVRASVLGINDTVIIAAALAGSLIAPVAVEVAGGGLLLGILSVLVLLVAAWARPTREPASPRGRHQVRATVGPTRLEAHVSAHPRVSPAVDRAARRAAVRRQRLLALERRQRALGGVPHQVDPAASPVEVRRAR
ncbi:MAG: transporter [Marmoricola sp.]|nr:transporter [Marmoricola sp.]